MLLHPQTATPSAAWQPPTLLPFNFHVYDIGTVLPRGRDTELLELARRAAVQHTFRPVMSTAREALDTEFTLETVNGEQLAAAAPWLHDLYTGWFRNLARRLVDEDLLTTSTLNRALSLNLLRKNGQRYPCHVDSQPVQGLWYLTSTSPQTGGGLVVARNRAARNVTDVDADRSIIYPQAGHLYLFDARNHAHYVEPMRIDVLRAVVTMNYYSPSCPETVRPAGLDQELFST